MQEECQAADHSAEEWEELMYAKGSLLDDIAKGIFSMAENREQRRIARMINPPIPAVPMQHRRLLLKPGTVPTENTAEDRNFMPNMGSLTPRQSDHPYGPFTKCRKVKGGFRVTKRYVIWS